MGIFNKKNKNKQLNIENPINENLNEDIEEKADDILFIDDGVDAASLFGGSSSFSFGETTKEKQENNTIEDVDVSKLFGGNDNTQEEGETPILENDTKPLLNENIEDKNIEDENLIVKNNEDPNILTPEKLSNKELSNMDILRIMKPEQVDQKATIDISKKKGKSSVDSLFKPSKSLNLDKNDILKKMRGEEIKKEEEVEAKAKRNEFVAIDENYVPPKKEDFLDENEELKEFLSKKEEIVEEEPENNVTTTPSFIENSTNESSKETIKDATDLINSFFESIQEEAKVEEKADTEETFNVEDNEINDVLNDEENVNEKFEAEGFIDEIFGTEDKQLSDLENDIKKENVLNSINEILEAQDDDIKNDDINEIKNEKIEEDYSIEESNYDNEENTKDEDDSIEILDDSVFDVIDKVEETKIVTPIINEEPKKEDSNPKKSSLNDILNSVIANIKENSTKNVEEIKPEPIEVVDITTSNTNDSSDDKTETLSSILDTNTIDTIEETNIVDDNITLGETEVVDITPSNESTSSLLSSILNSVDNEKPIEEPTSIVEDITNTNDEVKNEIEVIDNKTSELEVVEEPIKQKEESITLTNDEIVSLDEEESNVDISSLLNEKIEDIMSQEDLDNLDNTINNSSLDNINNALDKITEEKYNYIKARRKSLLKTKSLKEDITLKKEAELKAQEEEEALFQSQEDELKTKFVSVDEEFDKSVFEEQEEDYSKLFDEFNPFKGMSKEEIARQKLETKKQAKENLQKMEDEINGNKTIQIGNKIVSPMKEDLSNTPKLSNEDEVLAIEMKEEPIKDNSKENLDIVPYEKIAIEKEEVLTTNDFKNYNDETKTVNKSDIILKRFKLLENEINSIDFQVVFDYSTFISTYRNLRFEYLNKKKVKMAIRQREQIKKLQEAEENRIAKEMVEKEDKQREELMKKHNSPSRNSQRANLTKEYDRLSRLRQSAMEKPTSNNDDNFVFDKYKHTDSDVSLSELNKKLPRRALYDEFVDDYVEDFEDDEVRNENMYSQNNVRPPRR